MNLSYNYKKSALHWSLLTTLLLLPSWLYAASKPFLWQAQAPGQTVPVYLFGTIHSGNPEVNQLHPVVMNAFMSADTFVGELELDPASLQRLQLLTQKIPGTPALRDTLGTERVKRANKILRTFHPNLSVKLFEQSALWAFVAQFSTIEDQIRYPEAQPMDFSLLNEAKASGKKVKGLETAGEQVGVFTAFSDDELIEILDASMDGMESAFAKGETPMAQLYEAYLSGDITAFDQLMDEQIPLSPELADKLDQGLIIERNQKMAERIAALAKGTKHPIFVAVGAAHYDPDYGVQILLEKQGWTIQRLP